jgi:N-acetylglucosaminyldiphosphoundecaprenol N-acetyl-beta-D-mannosaminyltransferase
MMMHQNNTPTHPRVSLFDFAVDVVTPTTALQHVLACVAAQQTLQVVTLNPEMLMQGEQTPALGHVLKQAGLVLPDGAGLVWALHRAGHTQVKRLPGIEFAEHLLAYAAANQWRVAIIGAAPPVHAAAVANLTQRFVGLNVVVGQHGFFDDPQAVIAQCVTQVPQLVLVALGVPRQELFLAHELLPQLPAGTIGVGIGGSLDVWSGQKKRAPALMRTLNLEWLYRITSEPWRLQRVARTLPGFVVKVLSSKA